MVRIETVMKDIIAVDIRMRDNATAAHRVSVNKIAINEGINMMRTNINIFHRFSRVMNDTEIISKQFLGPTTELVGTSSVF